MEFCHRRLWIFSLHCILVYPILIIMWTNQLVHRDTYWLWCANIPLNSFRILSVGIDCSARMCVVLQSSRKLSVNALSRKWQLVKVFTPEIIIITDYACHFVTTQRVNSPCWEFSIDNKRSHFVRDHWNKQWLIDNWNCLRFQQTWKQTLFKLHGVMREKNTVLLDWVKIEWFCSSSSCLSLMRWSASFSSHRWLFSLSLEVDVLAEEAFISFHESISFQHTETVRSKVESEHIWPFGCITRELDNSGASDSYNDYVALEVRLSIQ
jgi:hypothetical protein